MKSAGRMLKKILSGKWKANEFMNTIANVANALINIAGYTNVRLNEPMSRHTTMKVGGPAAILVTPSGRESIIKCMEAIRENGISFFILGNGSNVIFKDEGFNGAVISLSEHFKGYRVPMRGMGKARVTVKSGTDNKRFSDAMIAKGLSGFEFASGIPGSVGGATAMNAGAYEGEMKQIIKEVTLLNPDGQVIRKNAEEMDFGYRHSFVSGTEYLILSTTFELTEDDPEKIRARVEDLKRRREEKQPLEYPSCGSTFKRPEGYFAGKLISDAGLKGYCVGGAQVSEKHAGFIINKDNASAKDILDLIDHVKNTVYDKFGVMLECEVKVVG